MTNRQGSARWLLVLSMATMARSAGGSDLASAPEAAETHVDVQWEAPEGCPDLNSVKRYAERLFGQPLEGRCGGNIQARGQVLRNEAGKWELELSIAVGEHVEQETLIANRCRALGDSMALKIALACDPLAVVQAIQPGTPEPGTNEPRPASTDRGVAAAQPAQDRADEPTDKRLGVRAMGGAGFDQLPGVSPGAALYGSLSWQLMRIELGGQYYWGADARYAALPDVGAHLELFSAAARACLIPNAGRFGFPVCGGVELGWMEGEGFGVDEPYTARSLWGAVVLGAAVRFPVDSTLALWLEGDAVISFLKAWI